MQRVSALLRKLCEQGHPIGHTVVRHSRGLGIARSRRRRPAARRRPSPRRSSWPGRAPPRGPPVRRRCSRGRSARRLEGEVEARQALMVESRTIAAPTARSICVQRRKKTFATLSPDERTSSRPVGMSQKCNNRASPHHSITLSARSMRSAGTSCPIALAVLRLITNSNRVGCSTGMSIGFAPRSTLTIIRASWRKISVIRGP